MIPSTQLHQRRRSQSWHVAVIIMLFILVVQNRSKEFDDKKIIKLEQANTRGIKQDKTVLDN